jgi:hypothetical protein
MMLRLGGPYRTDDPVAIRHLLGLGRIDYPALEQNCSCRIVADEEQKRAVHHKNVGWRRCDRCSSHYRHARGSCAITTYKKQDVCFSTQQPDTLSLPLLRL